jgi:hypothetical protein
LSALWKRSSLTTTDGWPTTSLFIVNICSPTHLCTFYTTVLHFLCSLYILVINLSAQFTMDFRSTHVLPWRKQITACIS